MMAAARQRPSVALAELLCPRVALPPDLDVAVTDLVMDHRAVTPGSVFFARRGARVDGARFAEQAASRGAVAMVRAGQGQARVTEAGLVEVPVDDVAATAGHAADRFFSAPSASLAVTAITGTNGKTSVAHFVAEALERHLDAAVGVLGTLGLGITGQRQDTGLTTPDCIEVHRALARFVAAGAGHAVMEASSHALDQQRLAAVRVRTAVFTNLSRDHLDYHGDMRQYAAAKARLFTRPDLRNAVLNAADPAVEHMRTALAEGVRVLDFALAGDAGARARAAVTGTLDASGREGLTLVVDGPGGSHCIRSPLPGRPAALNLLAAYAVLLAHEVTAADAAELLSRASPVPGRMQPLRAPGAPLVVVDYAHTPAALESLLEAVRALCPGRLWCVFGAGGDRDPGKRPLMGAAAAAGADHLVLTDDNPRSEDGDGIVAQVRAGIPAGRSASVRIQRDRARAIAAAVCEAREDDVVVVAGKGHEDYQDVAGVRRPFSDVAAVRAAFRERSR